MGAKAAVRFISEVASYRRPTFAERQHDISRARRLVGIAERRAATLRKLGVKK
jgi:hypothetical protein